MSYRCQECDNVHYGPANKVVREVRDISYNYYTLNRIRNEKERKPIFQFNSSGTEIVKELYLCDICASKEVDVKVNNTREINSVLKDKLNKSIEYTFDEENKRTQKERG